MRRVIHAIGGWKLVTASRSRRVRSLKRRPRKVDQIGCRGLLRHHAASIAQARSKAGGELGIVTSKLVCELPGRLEASGHCHCFLASMGWVHEAGSVAVPRFPTPTNASGRLFEGGIQPRTNEWYASRRRPHGLDAPGLVGQRFPGEPALLAQPFEYGGELLVRLGR